MMPRVMRAFYRNPLYSAYFPPGGPVEGIAGPGRNRNVYAWICECGVRNTGKFCAACGRKRKEPVKEVWICECGAENAGKFCTECGRKRKTDDDISWVCECGTENQGKFCTECGRKKEISCISWICECGVKNTGKFCPECGAGKPVPGEKTTDGE